MTTESIDACYAAEAIVPIALGAMTCSDWGKVSDIALPVFLFMLWTNYTRTIACLTFLQQWISAN